MIFIKIVAASLTGFFMAVASAEGLCKADESVVFNCELKESTSSLCQSQKNDDMTYRHGIATKMDMEVSYKKDEDNVFFFSSTPYAGGGEAHIRFSRHAYTYYIYDRTVKSEGGPISSAGIMIYKGRLKVANLMCENDASIKSIAHEFIKKENFHLIDTR